MAVPVTQDERDNWVEVGFSGGEAESSLIHSLCCVFTTNLSSSGLPEILAVDCESTARGNVKQVMGYLANYMVNSDVVVPDKLRFTLKMDEPLLYMYFASLHVTEPVQVTTLCEKYLGKASHPETILLLMPIVPRGSALWGQLPSPPEDKARMRDHIKVVLEDMNASPCGFLRAFDSNSSRTSSRKKSGKTKGEKSGKKKGSSKNDAIVRMRRVSLSDALKNPAWKVKWHETLTPRDLEYMKKHSDHFSAMAIDGIGEERANKYIAAVCDSAHKWQGWYKEGKTIEGSAGILPAKIGIRVQTSQYEYATSSSSVYNSELAQRET